ncbi:MAG: nucleotidyltransferase domain-containing protein [Negativicutes bacterium]|nr:nucleotidyltransferase domain-containing protein [Negativicutes bacterium]
MRFYWQEIEDIKEQLVSKFNPQEVILFGSRAKGRVTRRSDIDICVVFDTDNKRQAVRDILLEIDCKTDLDVVVYTPDEWRRYKDDMATFAGVINKTRGEFTW